MYPIQDSANIVLIFICYPFFKSLYTYNFNTYICYMNIKKANSAYNTHKIHKTINFLFFKQR